MDTRTLLICCLLLFAPPAWSQDETVAQEAGTARPLNLSLPRDAVRTDAAPLPQSAADASDARPVRPGAGPGWRGAACMPYGAGYEARRGMGRGRGRGGMGRQR